MVLHSIIVTIRVCTHCSRSGHTIEVCYRKHGFPPHFGKNHAIANSSSLEFNEEGEEIDDSKSDNICSYLRFLESYKQISPLHVRLPNGNIYGNNKVLKHSANFTWSDCTECVICP